MFVQEDTTNKNNKTKKRRKKQNKEVCAWVRKIYVKYSEQIL